MKAKIRNLQDRIERMGQKPETESAEWRARAEAEARQAWIVWHLSEDENLDLAGWLSSHNDESDLASDGRVRMILRKGEERAGKEPTSVYDEFKTKHMRMKALVGAGRLLTKAEGDELQALKAWLWDRSYLGRAALETRRGAQP